MSFSGMIDQLFTDPVLSKPATYLVQGTTAPFPVRVISKQPDTVVGFGDGQLHVSTTLFDVRSFDIPEPAVGDQITGRRRHLYRAIRTKGRPRAAGLDAGREACMRLQAAIQGNLKAMMAAEVKAAGTRRQRRRAAGHGWFEERIARSGDGCWPWGASR
jgi:hypothetical protein